jgi:hypothetical protein
LCTRYVPYIIVMNGRQSKATHGKIQGNYKWLEFVMLTSLLVENFRPFIFVAWSIHLWCTSIQEFTCLAPMIHKSSSDLKKNHHAVFLYSLKKYLNRSWTCLEYIFPIKVFEWF